MAEPAAIRYRAFMSYSHHDTAWAKWLHKALEDYRIDKDLVGRETPLGAVPKTLRPIFRDRQDFSSGSTLTAATVAALDASAALVVLCSTVSASRPAVNEEVRLFRSRHPDRPVIPIIIDGAPPDNFPPALRYELGTDGTMTDHPVTVLGPDLRDSGDGKSLGLAKVIAGLIGIGGHNNAHSPPKSPNWPLEISEWWGVAHEHRGQPDNREISMFADGVHRRKTVGTVAPRFHGCPVSDVI